MKKRVIGLLIIILITIIGFGIIYYKTNEKYIKSSRQYESIRRELKKNKARKKRYSFASLKKKTKNAFGYIYLKDTQIDYPIVKSPKKDNNYYLHHSAFGNYSFYGAIFTDYRCNYSSENIVIYGHHMDNGAMFGDLVKYRNKSFYDKHKRVEVWLKDKKLMCNVLSVFEASPNNDKVYTVSFESEDYDAWLNNIMTRSLYKTEVANEVKKTITLSTCTNTNSNRFIVVLERKN